MKNFICAFIMIVGLANVVKAQISFKTGNAEMETNLNSMNVEAKLDLGKFKAELALNFNTPAPKVETLFAMNVEPAEVFLMLQIGHIINKPVDEVATVYKANKGEGWGVIAKKMGIKPGSAEFHALKNSTKGKGKKGDKGKKGPKGGKGKK